MSTSVSSDRTASTVTGPPGGAREGLVVVHRTYVSHHAAHCAGGLTAGAHVLGPFADGPLGDVYGSTDAGMPADQPLDEPRRSASCGRVIPESDVRIADEAGQLVGAGAVGEILVRGREHGLVLTDYYGMPEARRPTFTTAGSALATSAGSTRTGICTSYLAAPRWPSPRRRHRRHRHRSRHRARPRHPCERRHRRPERTDRGRLPGLCSAAGAQSPHARRRAEALLRCAARFSCAALCRCRRHTPEERHPEDRTTRLAARALTLATLDVEHNPARPPAREAASR